MRIALEQDANHSSVSPTLSQLSKTEFLYEVKLFLTPQVSKQLTKHKKMHQEKGMLKTVTK